MRRNHLRTPVPPPVTPTRSAAKVTKSFLSSTSLEEVLGCGGVPPARVAETVLTLKPMLRRLDVQGLERIVSFCRAATPHSGEGGFPVFPLTPRVSHVTTLIGTNERLVLARRGRFLTYPLQGASVTKGVVRGGQGQRWIAFDSTAGSLRWDVDWPPRHVFADVQLIEGALQAAVQSANPTRRSPSGMHPAPRLIRVPHDAEQVVAEWMQFWTGEEATCTPVGADGGVDVLNPRVLSQVKMEAVPTSRPIVQQIYGIASLERKMAAVFSLAGFTQEALDWAHRAGVALFTFNLQGEPLALNATAERLSGAE